ncbi:Rv0340 family IniB-related protein [Mycolicibacterium baixiangningiae]|uniref:Rv0340 family IniB-related protein n=1 Tax=Mycolicibacterium baixiangningiae TaxID=2761578 RepID=UPI001868EE0F|nr:Rv0340 family IniB-related protein [Mycolicibacterium baixiangningiae]
MANSLLDFVMSLVRDPNAAARYAADPAAAIADAQLPDVTSVDVDNLIPVVTESMPVAAPSTGLDAFGAEPASNVWASGAATAAFDAFDDSFPAQAVIDAGSTVIDTTGPADPAVDVLTQPDLLDDAASSQFTDPVFDDAAPADGDLADVWGAAGDHPQPADHTPGFDLFD